MNKKGFTLMELLAIIAILGVLGVLIMTNVLKSMKDSRKKVFMTDLQTVYKNAISQSQIDSGGKKTANTYCRIDGVSCVTIDNSGVRHEYKMVALDGDKATSYIIGVDKNYNVIFLAASNLQYQYYHNGTIEDVTQITEDDIQTIGEVSTVELVDLKSIIKNYEN